MAYISKLENKKAEYIEHEVLMSIFEYMLGEKEFQENILPILEKTTIERTEKEIEKQEWIQLFDLQHRLIPIPGSLVSYLEQKIKELNVPSEKVIEKMNANEELNLPQSELGTQEKNTLIFDHKKGRILPHYLRAE